MSPDIGVSVVVNFGPFKGCVGKIVASQTGSRRVVVDVAFTGGKTLPVELDMNMVQYPPANARPASKAASNQNLA